MTKINVMEDSTTKKTLQNVSNNCVTKHCPIIIDETYDSNGEFVDDDYEYEEEEFDNDYDDDDDD